VTKPLVSVIIPTYNRAEFIAETVESVLNQTYSNIETIIVDDGSTDNTRDVLKKYQDKIDYIYQDRSERSKARNEGVRHSQGDYIAFLDSDDVWFPTKIEKQVQILDEKPVVGVVYTGVQYIDTHGDPYVGEISWDVLKRKRPSLYEDLMTHNVISGSSSSVMIRRHCMDRVGLFDESMNACEDLDLWRRLAQHFAFYKIESPLVKLRIHMGSTQQNLTLMAKGYERIIKKISRETPPEFEYYKNEAIIKLLFQIASLYKHDSNLHSFLWFCGKSVFHWPSWMIKWTFFRHFLILLMKRYAISDR
jgi:glycosyltransferase involved in cell wall biosynthesis